MLCDRERAGASHPVLYIPAHQECSGPSVVLRSAKFPKSPMCRVHASQGFARCCVTRAVILNFFDCHFCIALPLNASAGSQSVRMRRRQRCTSHGLDNAHCSDYGCGCGYGRTRGQSPWQGHGLGLSNFSARVMATAMTGPLRWPWLRIWPCDGHGRDDFWVVDACRFRLLTTWLATNI